MTTELLYWPMLPGRGEFVRLYLEALEHPYVDSAREHGTWIVTEALGRSAFAPPILKDGDQVLSQTANILMYLAQTHDSRRFDRYACNALVLTIMDWVSEAHDTHHPISTAFVYEDQIPAAKRAAQAFVEHRIPKYIDHFERQLVGEWLFQQWTAADLALAHTYRGIRHAFPRTSPTSDALEAHADRVEALPAIAAYRTSDRCLDYTQHGIFRHYPELESS